MGTHSFTPCGPLGGEGPSLTAQIRAHEASLSRGSRLGTNEGHTQSARGVGPDVDTVASQFPPALPPHGQCCHQLKVRNPTWALILDDVNLDLQRHPSGQWRCPDWQGLPANSLPDGGVGTASGPGLSDRPRLALVSHSLSDRPRDRRPPVGAAG